MQQVQEHVLKISRVIDETPSVKAFQLELPENAKIDFYPGQFYMVSFVDEPEIKVSRAYSIASSPLNKEYIEIALDKVGIFTTKLFSKKAGDFLKFKGPYGKFYFNEEIKNDLVLIAGGTGITPLIGIARYCNDKKLSNKIKLIYSVKIPNEIVYRNEIDSLKKANKNFDYLVTITRAEEQSNGERVSSRTSQVTNWNGRKGRIDLELLKENINGIENSIYFLCGSKEFVDSIINMLIDLGVKKEQIKTDVWG